MNITEALTNLVTGTFIIEKQPPQVSYFCNLIFLKERYSYLSNKRAVANNVLGKIAKIE